MTDEQKERLLLLAKAEEESGAGGIMACSPEILAHMKEHDPVMYAYAMGELFEPTD